MKKLNIFSAIIMVAGLITSSFVQGQSCDTLRNYIPGANFSGYTINATNLVLGHMTGNDSVDDYEFTEYAEKYNAPSATTVRAINFAPATVEDVSGTATLVINIYAVNGTEPGAILGSQVVAFDDLTEGSWNLVEFDTPVSVSGDFYAGYELSYTNYPNDLFSLYTSVVTNGFTLVYSSTVGGGAPGQFEEWDDIGGWVLVDNVALESAFAFEVLTSMGDAPTADFTVSSAEICLGGQIAVDGSTSTGTIDTYNWSLTDYNPISVEYVEFDGSVTDVITPTVSSSDQQAIFLFVYGACTFAYKGGLVTILPNVDATVTTVNDNCGVGTGSISIAATGGGISYLYSINGGTTTSPTGTFNNLTAGTYNVEVTTLGDGCSYTETVSVGNNPGELITVGADQTVCNGTAASLTASGAGSIEWFTGGVSVGTGTTLSLSPAVTTVYDAILTDANGCTDTDQVTVTVTPLEDATFAYPSNTICTGGSNVSPTTTTAGGIFTFTGTGLVFANTTTGEIDMSTSAVGTYVITYTTAGTCSGTETQSITITASPDATFNYANSEYCQNEGATSPTFPTGASAGTFTSTTGLTIAPGTGAINFATSADGVYVVTNTIAASGSCPATSKTFSVTVKASPVVNAGADEAVCQGTDVTLTATGADTYTWDNSVTQATAFTPAIGTTVYTVTGTGTNGCTATDQVTVVVTANPTINAGTDQAVCEGTEVTLTAANSGGTVTWDNGVTNGTPFTPTVTTTYTATANNNGCTATDDVTVTINPLPTVSAGADQTACVNHSAIALSGTPSGGTFSGAGVTGNNFDPATATIGAHTVTYTFTDGNQCENSATIVITVDGCVGVDKNELNELTVSPNPASEYIEVRVNENNTIKSIQVMSLEGKVVSVATTVVDNHTTQLDVSSLAKGTYLIQLSTDNGQLTRKVIVQ